MNSLVLNKPDLIANLLLSFKKVQRITFKMLCSTFLYETYARAIFSLKKNLTAPAFTEGLFVPTP